MKKEYVSPSLLEMKIACVKIVCNSPEGQQPDDLNDMFDGAPARQIYM